jgi:hypothetical protein
MSLIFLIYLILLAALWPWGLIKPLTEMGNKERPERKADKLTTICEPTA